jgi:KDO2-lipid IV(A) lauroyltransferase
MTATTPARKKRKKRKAPTWMQGPVYGLVRAGAGVTQLAGVNNSMRALRGFGGAFAQAPFNRKRLQRAIDNISWCFPHWDEQRVREHAIESYKHLFMLVVEVCSAPRLLTEDGYAACVEIGDLRSGLRAVLADGPCILVTGHSGNWELLGYTMALLGFPLHALYRPLDSKPLDEWVFETRSRRGLILVDKFGAARRLPGLLQAGAPVGFIADQNAGDRGMFVPFFDRLASAYKAIGLMAIQHNATIICGQARRLSGMSADEGDHHGLAERNSQIFRYRLELTDLIRPADWTGQPDPLFYITARYRRAIEAMVRRAPEQYLWMHRYWKSRPPHEHRGKEFPPKLREKLEQLPWMTPDALGRIIERSERDAAEFRATLKDSPESVIAPGPVAPDTASPADGPSSSRPSPS